MTEFLFMLKSNATPEIYIRKTCNIQQIHKSLAFKIMTALGMKDKWLTFLVARGYSVSLKATLETLHKGC